jgi:hypothetical protein
LICALTAGAFRVESTPVRRFDLRALLQMRGQTAILEKKTDG